MPVLRFLSAARAALPHPVAAEDPEYLLEIVKAVVLSGALAAAIFAQPFGLYWNDTPSEPEGLYLLWPLRAGSELHRGERVVFRYECPKVDGRCPFSSVAPYPDGAKFVKRIGAVPGDVLNTQGLSYWVTTPSGRRHTLGVALTKAPDGQRIPLRQHWHATRVPTNRYYLSSMRVPISFDSRYFGLVPRARITAHAMLLAAF